MKWVHLAGLTAAYAAASCLGLVWAEVDGAGSPVWPAAGVGIAGLMLGGVELWPAVLVGRLAASVITQSKQPLLAELFIAIGNAMAVALPCMLMNAQRVSRKLETLSDMLQFILFAGVLSGLLSALVGVATLSFSSGLSEERMWSIFKFWLVGNFAGTLIVGPLILSWARIIDPLSQQKLTMASALPIAAVALASFFIFNASGASEFRAWHLMPLLVWAALASRIAATTSLAILGVLAVWGTAHGAVPFTDASLPVADRVVVLQEFLSMMALTVLIMSAVALETEQDQQKDLRIALDGADQGAFFYDCTTQISNWDSRTSQLLGLPPRDHAVTFEQIFERVHPEDRLAVQEAFRSSLEASGNGVFDAEHRVVTDDGSTKWVAVRGQTVFAGEGQRRIPVSTRGVVRDITAQKQAQEQMLMLSREVAHRAKNQLAVVQSIASRTLTGPITLDEARQKIVGRLQALAGAFDLLHASSMEHAALQDIVMSELEQFAGRFEVDGPHVRVNPDAAQSLQLMIHELATNAAKYGAWSNGDGRAVITWKISDDHKLHFEWREMTSFVLGVTDGASRKGFGSTLIERVVPTQVSGEATLSFLPTGLLYTLKCPVSAIGKAAYVAHDGARADGIATSEGGGEIDEWSSARQAKRTARTA
jgi:PAS domain S-box-containing protein